MKMIPKARKLNIVIQELDDETLIYDLENDRAYCLNETSGLVWKCCDGEKSPTMIADEISRKTSKPVSEEFVLIALEQLSTKGLLAEEISAAFPTGQNRRELLRRIGYSSMIALPLISTVVAPASVQAQSCLGIEIACGADSECCTGICNTNLNTCCTIQGSAARPSGSRICTNNTCDDYGTNNCCSGNAFEDTGTDCMLGPGIILCQCL